MLQLSEDNLIWIDLEMTGLSVEHDRIIEIATIVTSSSLDQAVEGPVFAVKQDKTLLQGMNEWCTKQHTKSGLVDKVLESVVTQEEAEAQTLAFLARYVPSGKSPMCGNSICTDRRFLARYMPTLEAFFHYRHIDVSTLKELAQRWKPEILQGLTKASKHLALDDIKDSIAELQYYQAHFIR